jgi:hypothetical protein
MMEQGRCELTWTWILVKKKIIKLNSTLILGSMSSIDVTFRVLGCGI